MASKAKNYNVTGVPFGPHHNCSGLPRGNEDGGYFHHQPPPMTPDNCQPYAIDGILVLLFFAVVFAFILFLFVICVYGGPSMSGRPNISWRRRFSFPREDPLSILNVGLEGLVIESLPVFEYKAQSFKDALECAVCLSEFEENEKARFLPNCKHSFHVDCIDMWFHSHSTCPICRTGAQPKQRVGNNNTDEISITLEMISSGNREIRIRPGVEQGESSSQEPETAVDEGPSTTVISSMPETAIAMPARPENFLSEKQACSHSGSQNALHSLKRMLSRGREGRVLPDALQDHGIETEGQPQSQSQTHGYNNFTDLQFR